MAVYSELIKSFDKVRDYVRDFYIFGFRTREDYNTKSKRTYDNEKRRIESWLSDYVHTELSGHKKKVAVKIDCSRIYQNPLYKCFKSATYTENDIKLHFMPLENPKGQAVWYVYKHSKTKAAYIKEFNEDSGKYIGLLNPDDYDLD